MFGIGLTELLVIAVLILVFVGPEKLPDLMKSAGKLFGEVKGATDELKRSINVEEAIKTRTEQMAASDGDEEKAGEEGKG